MRRFWLAFTAVVVLSFAVLGWTGVRIYQQAPPVPERVVTTDARQVLGPDDIFDGQNVWQSMGGMEVGSVTSRKEGLLKFGFWATNIGLLAMVMLSLLPVGLMQTWASVEHGYWYARSPEFLQTATIETFRWLRVIGDTIFAAGALVIFVMSLRTGKAARHLAFSIPAPAPIP